MTAVPERPGQLAPTPLRGWPAALFCGSVVVVTIMPAFLIGASGTLVRNELGFDAAALGLVVATFFACSSLGSLWSGWVIERLGPRGGMRLAVAGTAVCLLLVGGTARSLVSLAMVLAMAGFCNSLSHPATNVALARTGSVRSGTLFGVKQASVPVATMLAGASVPAVSASVGWRWSLVAGAGLAILTMLLVPRSLGADTGAVIPSSVRSDVRSWSLYLLGLALGLGTAAATAMGAFLVESAVASGMSLDAAGWTMVVGSCSGIVARVLAGHAVDQRPGSALAMATVFLVVGSGGYVLLSGGGAVSTVLGAVVSYAFGWGWTGLMMFEAVRLAPQSPAQASAIVQMGGSAGAASGPLLLGLAVTHLSFRTAWLIAGLVSLAAAGLVRLAGLVIAGGGDA